ncbi:MAG: glycoside hydrolase family 30 protein [Clostridia bacterium]|nr:glycoside hydrolase family 30 protein [Clostridia bacterium]
MKISIDSGKVHSIFEGFGASGAWWAQEVGGWSHTDDKSGIAVRDEISRLLYDKNYGIGLRTYRYNIGAGSAESGNGEIGNPLRRTESFDAGEGKYDFTRDANAVYMMKQAAKDGADEIILFVNSPIERLTKNGWSHLKKYQIMRDNIAPENFQAFADYCLDVTEYFVSQGLPVKYLSPVNEPVWIWNGGQEGCHYSPWSAARVMKCFADELKRRPSLKDVKLSGVESGDIRWFNKSFTRALMKYESVRDCIDSVDVHSYFLKFPVPLPFKFVDDRHGFLRRYRKWLDKHYPDLPVKMSEWCHMQGGRDKTMDSGLVTANVIYDDISILNVTSWQHWIAVSEVDYCDGLIYINLDDKTYEMTKRYYVTGNFSKYIPFGASRVDAVCEDNELKVLAFVKDGRTVVVVINDTDKEKTVSVDADAVTLVVTDKDNDLAESSVNGKDIRLSAKSVSTIIF